MNDFPETIEPGQWIEVHDGYGQVLFLAVSWYEEYENLPEGATTGQEKMTRVVYRKLCNYEGKGRMVIDSCNLRICNPIQGEGQELVDSLLADPKVRGRFESLSPPANFGLVVNLCYDLPRSDVESITAAVEHFRRTRGANFVFRVFSEAVPALAKPPHSVAFDAPAGFVRCELQLLNPMFETHDRERVFDTLQWKAK